MNDFYTLLRDKLSKIEQIKLNKYLEVHIQEQVIKLLKVKDIGKLRDKFEGQAYLDKKTDLVFSYYVASDYIGLKRPKITYEFVDQIKPLIQSDKKKYVIKTFNAGDFPEFDDKDYLAPRILLMKRDKYTYGIFGVLNISELNNRKNFEYFTRTGSRMKKLINFDIIEDFN